jgi:type I restriction enzyme S subunit
MTRIKEARKLRQESKEKTELLWQSALAETFPKPGTQLPNGWQWVKLGEVSHIFSGTWGEEPSDAHGSNVTLARVIRVSDVKESLTIDYENVPLRLISLSNAKRFALRDEDIVVVKSSGSKAKIISGRAALFREQPELFIPSNFVFAVRCNSSYINPIFLWYWLNSNPVKEFIEQIVTAFTYPNLKKSDYVRLPVPLPPLEEQKRIVAHLQALQEKIKSLKESQTHTETKLKELENSILDKAFKGEL